uniref:Myelin basic protein-like n=1 Tax=Sinocyclocheilus anshuiensis TaxID=1608454 RepID=A0A671PZR5_9TELE
MRETVKGAWGSILENMSHFLFPRDHQQYLNTSQQTHRSHKMRYLGSFRGGLSASPQRSSASPRRRPDENAVVHFFRTIVSPSTPKSRRDQKSQSSTKGQKGRGDTLTRIFKLGGSQPASTTKR